MFSEKTARIRLMLTLRAISSYRHAPVTPWKDRIEARAAAPFHLAVPGGQALGAS